MTTPREINRGRISSRIQPGLGHIQFVAHKTLQRPPDLGVELAVLLRRAEGFGCGRAAVSHLGWRGDLARRPTSPCTRS